MEEETRQAIEDAIISGHLRLVRKVIKIAAKDARLSPRINLCARKDEYAVAHRAGFDEPRDEAQAFFASEGFLWLLQLIGCEPEDLGDVAGQIATRATEMAEG